MSAELVRFVVKDGQNDKDGYKHNVILMWNLQEALFEKKDMFLRTSICSRGIRENQYVRMRHSWRGFYDFGGRRFQESKGFLPG
jgi:hypothetical protein